MNMDDMLFCKTIDREDSAIIDPTHVIAMIEATKKLEGKEGEERVSIGTVVYLTNGQYIGVIEPIEELSDLVWGKKLMPWDALPEHIDEPSEWEGTDWDNKWQRWMLKIKGFFAYGHRSKHWWAKWRVVPKDLLNLHATRREIYTLKQDGEMPDGVKITAEKDYGYTSVIQYWERWHLLIQWPLHLSFHVYWKKSTVPKKPDHTDYGITEMFYIRFGARFDNDGVYWFPSLFIGGDWN